MMEEYRKVIHELQPTIGATLYHYCPTDKLRYLLEPGADLNCRYLTYQGDKEEYRFGAKVFCGYVRAKGCELMALGDCLEDNLVSNIGCVGQKLATPLIPLTFSLTEKFNSQYHYKEYCKNGGCAIAFSQGELDTAMDAMTHKGISLRLVKCYYEGKDSQEINAICEAVWNDRRGDFKRLMESSYQDADAGKAVLGEICMAACHFKRKQFASDQEWRIVMVAANTVVVEANGFKASGLRDCTMRSDLIDLMNGVVVYATVNREQTIKELSRFALQQRKRDFKVCV